MEKIVLRSEFAYLCLGILLTYSLEFFPHFHHHYLVIFITSTTICLVLLAFVKKKIFKSVVWGLLIGLTLLAFRTYISKQKEIKTIQALNHLSELKSLEAQELQIRITPIKLIRKKLFLARIQYPVIKKGFSSQDKSSTELNTVTPGLKNITPNLKKIHKDFENIPIDREIPIYRKDDTEIHSLLCPVESIQPKKIQKNEFFFPYTKRLGGHLIYIQEWKCKKLEPIEFPESMARKKIMDFLIRGNIKGNFRGIAMGLVFGDSHYLSDEIYKSARDTGTLHLFAASGLHLGIFIGSLYAFGRYILRLGYYPGLLFPMGFAWFYLYILSFPVSLTRAYFFALVLVGSKSVFRKMHPLDLIVASAGMIYIFREDSFLGAGFLLSFSAVSGIFFLKPRLDHLVFGEKLESKFISILSNNLTLTLSANLATLPIAWIYFPGYSFGSVLSNFILVPLTGIVLPLLYLSLFLESFLPNSIADFFWVWTDLGLRLLVLGTEVFSDSIGYFSSWGEGKHLTLLTLGVMIGWIFFLTTTKKIRYFHSISTLSILVLFFILAYRMNSSRLDDIRFQLPQGNIFYSDHSFFYIENKTISIGGYCKRDFQKIKSHLTEKICKSINRFYIDHESCIHFLRFCHRKNQSIEIAFGSKYLKDWAGAFPNTKWSIVKKNSLFTDIDNSKILFYKSGWDPDWLPGYIQKKYPNVKIILQSPNPPKRSRMKKYSKYPKKSYLSKFSKYKKFKKYPNYPKKSKKWKQQKFRKTKKEN